MAGQFTKKAVDIEALMAQAAAMEAEAQKEAQAPKKGAKKEKKEKEKREKESTKKESSSKKESTKKESSKKDKESKSKKESKKKNSKSKKGVPEKARKVFGLPLQDLELEDDCMPIIYTELISVLEGYATEVEGLFRKTASTAAVDELIVKYEAGEDIDWGTIEDRHLIGGVLMAFLLRLPEPLITFDAYEKLINIQESGAERTEQYKQAKKIISSLPELNHTMLEHLLDFLDTMTRDSDDNLMTADNLAICFGPGLMRRKEDNLAQLMKEAGMVTTTVAFLIEQFGYFFRDENIDQDQKPTKQASVADFNAFIDAAVNGFNLTTKLLQAIITDLQLEKLWNVNSLAHLSIAENLLSQIFNDEVVKITVADVEKEIEKSLAKYTSLLQSKAIENSCSILKNSLNKYVSLIEDTKAVLNNQAKEKDVVLQACRLSNNCKTLLENIQPHIVRDLNVSSSDISVVKTLVPQIVPKLNEMKKRLDSGTNYQYVVVLSRVIRGIQKGLKERSKVPISEVDLEIGSAAPGANDKGKITSLQDALEFSFPACSKILKEMSAAADDPTKKNEVIRDLAVLEEVSKLLDNFLKINPSGAPSPLVPHPSAGGVPPPVAPHPSAGGTPPPPVAPHPSAGGTPPPVAPHPASAGTPQKRSAPPPTSPHPSVAKPPTKPAPRAAPPPVAPHPASRAAPPPVAPHPAARHTQSREK